MAEDRLTGVSMAHETRYLEEVKKLALEAATGIPCRIVLFGSRVNGELKRSSDFDIGIEGLGRREFLRLKRRITEAVEKSSVPHFVDVVDLSTADKKFRDIALRKIEIWKTS